MQFKGTLILLAVFLGLGGYVYFAEYRGQEERQKADDAEKKVFPVEASKITAITLEYPDLEVSAVRKGESEWEIVAPSGLEADAAEWNSLASNIARVERDETVLSEAGDLAAYGLDQPAVKVTATAEGLEAPVTLLFGSENPKKTFNYAMLGGKNEVFLTASSWIGLFRKSLKDLRNKQLMDFDAESIDLLKITGGTVPEIEIVRTGDGWTFTKPVEAKADSTEVLSFLSSIQAERAMEFADGMDLRTTGLESPSVRVTLHDSMAGADKTVLFGRSPEAGKFYAKDGARPAVFVIGSEVVEKARRPVFDWRDKTVADFNPEEIDEIEIVRGGAKHSAKKIGTAWQLTDGRQISEGKVPELVRGIIFERALGIIDNPAASAYGMNTPRLEIFLRKGGQEVFSLKFGQDSSNPAGIYAKSSARPAVLALSRSLYDSFNINLNDLIENQPAAEAPAR